ncbi:hypothetical protein SAMN06265365_11247 [Tistlia consotensis]|uniref:Uncharacterized protein n=1 Tax=Tistlia consotensis USBA 355 TaxID=560819 RepID=A0A1Y6C4L0_9PROT|nr:hypothetical protein [Tistlia consotensis]SMF36101.1 hypothetical protein SAMN05428998_11247 [Tistlia consotensis USBA 355]SNR71426.1 hypothetical protein SAMN06265365_11247 [Tistlia consotensis]
MTLALPIAPDRARRRPTRLAALLLLALFLPSLFLPSLWGGSAEPGPRHAVAPRAGAAGEQLRSSDGAAPAPAILPDRSGPEASVLEPSVRRLVKLAEASASPTALPAAVPVAEAPVAAGGRVFAAAPAWAPQPARSRLRNRGPPSA